MALDALVEEIEMSEEHTKEDIETDSQEYEKLFIEKFGNAAKEEFHTTAIRYSTKEEFENAKRMMKKRRQAKVKPKRIRHL